MLGLILEELIEAAGRLLLPLATVGLVNNHALRVALSLGRGSVGVESAQLQLFLLLGVWLGLLLPLEVLIFLLVKSVMYPTGDGGSRLIRARLSVSAGLSRVLGFSGG